MENIEYEIAYNLWSKDIHSISQLSDISIKELESKYEFSLEEVDSILLDNWDRWDDEMEEFFEIEECLRKSKTQSYWLSMDGFCNEEVKSIFYRKLNNKK